MLVLLNCGVELESSQSVIVVEESRYDSSWNQVMNNSVFKGERKKVRVAIVCYWVYEEFRAPIQQAISHT
jgi:hypothetical protein